MGESAVIMFKACPRCGGDVDATYSEDVYCVQCAYRPEVRYPGPRIGRRPDAFSGERMRGTELAPQRDAPVMALVRAPRLNADDVATPPCPRCWAQDCVALDKLVQEANTCYRCRRCGHIYSPPAGRAGEM